MTGETGHRTSDPGDCTLVAVGTRRYRRSDLADLSQVPTSLRTVVEALRLIGVSTATHGEGFLLDPDRAGFLSAVEEVVAIAPVVIVYYTGHGIVVNSKYYLPMSGTVADVAASAVATRELVEDYVLRRDEYGDRQFHQPDVLIILDCCFSTTAALEGVVSHLQGIGNDNVWIMASANTTEYAQEGVFADALAECVRNPRTGFSQSHLSLDVLVGDINARAKEAGFEQEARWFPPTRRGVTGVPPFFPNIDFHPNYSGYTVEQQRHWVSKLRAGPDSETLAGFYLTARGGRVRAIEELTWFLVDASAGRLAIVTGSPGSGKSTVLAVLALLGDARTRARLLSDARGNAVVQRAAAKLGEVDNVLSIHVRGMNTTQIAGVVARRLEWRGTNPAELVEYLADNPHVLPNPVLLVDAIDESATPSGVVEFLLELSARTSLRCVVGTRRHLLKNVADTRGRVVIDLDLPRYRDSEALTEYVRSLLVGAQEPNLATPYRAAGHSTAGGDIASVVATAITERASTAASESFLMARLLALAMRSRPMVIDVRDSDWHNDIPDTVGAAFDEDLRRLGSHERSTRRVLTALAWAKGAGLPWETVWAPVAEAIAATSAELTDEHIRWVLDNAGSYIIEDVGAGGRSVFRVFHELLAEHLRRASVSAIRRETSDWPIAFDAVDRGAARVHRRVYDGLLSIVPKSPAGFFRWDVAHPYIRTHLAEHAYDSEGSPIDALIEDGDFLSSADPAALSSVLISLDRHPAHVTSYLRTARLLGDTPALNAAYVHESAAAVSGIRAAIESDLIHPRYRTIATWTRHDNSMLTIRAHQQPIISLAFFTSREGQGILVTMDSGFEVGQWDATSGKLLARLPPPDFDQDGWDETEIPAGRFVHAGVSEVGFLLWNSARSVYITEPEVIYLVEADHRRREHRTREIALIPFGRLRARLRTLGLNTTIIGGGVVAAGLDEHGRMLLVRAVGRRNVLIDLDSGRKLVSATLEGSHLGDVAAMGFGLGRDESAVLATVEGVVVCIRDPKTGALVEPRYTLPPRVADGVSAVGVTSAKGAAPLVILGAATGEVSLLQWSGAGAPRRHTALEGHRSRVTTTAFDRTRSGPMTFVTGDAVGEVRMWRTDHAPNRRGSRFDVSYVAVGPGRDDQTTMAVGHDDGTLSLAPLGSTSSVRTPVATAAITAMAFTTFDGKDVLAVGDSTGTVRLIGLGESERGLLPVSAGSAGAVMTIRFGHVDGRPCMGVCYADAVLVWKLAVDNRFELLGHAAPPVGVAEQMPSPRGRPRPYLPASGGGGSPVISGAARRDVWLARWVTRGVRAHPLDIFIGPSQTFVTSRRAVPSGNDHPLSLLPGWPHTDAETISKFTIAGWDGSRHLPQLFAEDVVSALAMGTDAHARPLVVFGGSTGPVEVRDLLTGAQVDGAVLHHDRPVRLLAIGTGTSSTRVVTCDDTDTIRVWDLRSGHEEIALSRLSRPVHLQLYQDLLVIGEEDGWAVLDIG